jgi:cytochrome P450
MGGYYVWQHTKESTKLYPPSRIISRCGEQKDTIGGFHIPTCSIALISPFVIHRHPRCWMNRNGFGPDRFKSRSDDQRPPFAYLPFGGSPG